MNRKTKFCVLAGALALLPLGSCSSLNVSKSKGEVPVASIPYDSISNITRDNLRALPGQRVRVLPKVHSGKGGETGVTLLTRRPGMDGYSNSTVVNPDQSMAVYKSRAGAFDNQVFEIVGVDSVERKGKEEVLKNFYLVVRNENYPQKHWLELGETYDIYAGGKLDEVGELVVTDLATEGYIAKLNEQMRGRKLVNKSENNRSEFSLDHVVRKVADGTPLQSVPKDHVWEVTGVEVVSTPQYAGLSYMLTSPKIKGVCSVASELNFIPYEDFMADSKSDQARLKSLIRKYGRTNGRMISEGKVAKGFTTKMCEEALGAPAQVEKRTVRKRVEEKWTYLSGATLTFRSGRLVATAQ